MWTVHFSQWCDVWCGKHAVHLYSTGPLTVHTVVCCLVHIITLRESLKSYYKWGGQIKNDHLILPLSLISTLTARKACSQNWRITVRYKSRQWWNLQQLQDCAFTNMHRPQIRTVHICIGVGGGCRFPQLWSNSTHGSLLQWGCDVPSFNIPWLYNGTWVTSHGALCSSSPSVYLSLLIFWLLGKLHCILHWPDMHQSK